MRIAILTVSDAGSRGKRQDTSGDAIAEWAKQRGYEIAAREVVPDEVNDIAPRLLRWCDSGLADLVITTGGTGISARDITPEATAGVIQKPLPGIAEAMRMSAWTRVPAAILSRGLAGTRGKTLIVNLPGSTGGVKEGLAVLEKVVEHAVELLRGNTQH
ncbi:MAG: MogA/MoaB family molybdenum cofactor biosynthesis protein [Gemmatimonadota bacterium]